MAKKYTEDDLIEEIQRLADELGERPTWDDMRIRGEISTKPFKNRFGSWASAIEAAGFRTHKDSYTDEELIDELHRLRQEIGETPTWQDMLEDGRMSPKTFENHFGSWSAAVQAAGLTPYAYVGYDADDLLEHLQGLAEELGETPTQKQVERAEGPSVKPYVNRFGGYNQALRKAGFEPNKPLDGTVILTCDECGEDYEEYQSRVEQSRCCSLDCLHEWRGTINGADHPNWRGGRENYGRNWRKQRRACLARDDNRCRVCEMTMGEHQDEWGQQLHVHHIIPARKFDDPEARNDLNNLITLCRSCHNRWEGIPVIPSTDEAVN